NDQEPLFPPREIRDRAEHRHAERHDDCGYVQRGTPHHGPRPGIVGDHVHEEKIEDERDDQRVERRAGEVVEAPAHDLPAFDLHGWILTTRRVRDSTGADRSPAPGRSIVPVAVTVSSLEYMSDADSSHSVVASPEPTSR